jgi:hypothetical protein
MLHSKSSKASFFQTAIYFASIIPILIGEILILVVYFDCKGLIRYDGRYIGECRSFIPEILIAANIIITSIVLYLKFPKKTAQIIALNFIWKCAFVIWSLYIPDECRGYTYLPYVIVPIIVLSNFAAGIFSVLAELLMRYMKKMNRSKYIKS